MHFEVGIIVAFVKITKPTVVLPRENTGGKSDPLNPVNLKQGGRTVWVSTAHSRFVSHSFPKPVHPSNQGCVFQVKVNFAGVFQNLTTGFGKQYFAFSPVLWASCLFPWPCPSDVLRLHSLRQRITSAYPTMTSCLMYLNLQMQQWLYLNLH